MLLETLSGSEYLARLTTELGGATSAHGGTGRGLSLTVIPFEQVTSTMDEARDWRGLATNPELPRCACFWPDELGEPLDAICFLAREQIAGRGREDRRWSSGRDRGIYATFLFLPECSVAALGGYSLVVGLAVQSALRRFGALPIVKWPNDIVVERTPGDYRKLGGILVDTVGGSNGPLRVSVGVGINVLPQPLPAGSQGLAPIALAEISSEQADTLSVFRAVAFELMVHSRDFFAAGFERFQRRWERESGFVGREVVVSSPHQPPLSGRVQGVDARGGLLVADDGEVRVCYSGSVTLGCSGSVEGHVDEP